MVQYFVKHRDSFTYTLLYFTLRFSGCYLSYELHNLYAAPNIITVIKSREYEMGGACNTYGKNEKYKILVRKSEKKRLLLRPRRK